MEKPDLDGRQLANTGAYMFPAEVFDTELSVSARGEYEITDYVSALAQRRTVNVVETRLLATDWDGRSMARSAQSLDLASVLTLKRRNDGRSVSFYLSRVKFTGRGDQFLKMTG